MGKSVYERFGSSGLSGSNQTARRHTVTSAETLPLIASLEFDIEYDSELWRQVAEANGIADLDSVAPGTVLVIPSPSPTST